MELAGASPMGWLFLILVGLACGWGLFYAVYGLIYVFEGESAPDDASTWLLNHRTPIVIVLGIMSLIVIAVVASQV